jgi:hypothetical protein
VPPNNAADPAVQCLDKVAAEASTRLQQTVVRIAPRDSALTWKAASVHPLQALETEYQGIVHDAVRGIASLDARKTIESKALGDFFFFDGGAPRLLGIAPGEPYAGMPYPFLEDRLREGRAQLKAAQRLMQPPPNRKIKGPALRKHLTAAWDAAEAVRQGCFALPGSSHWPVADVVAAGQALAGLDRAIPTVNRIQDFEIIIRRLKTANAHLEQVLVGVGAVQMFYVIESFYLFRLLVRYRIESDRALTSEAVAGASGTLTDIVTNGHAWLSIWLRDKIVELAERIAAVDPSGNTLFFLKGGRAIQYLMGTPDAGRNDWDCQIVINPDLPAAIWYGLFLRVSNEVLLALKAFKVELYMLLSDRAVDFMTELGAGAVPPAAEEPPEDEAFDLIGIDEVDDGPAGDDPPAAAPAAYRANCKAELIDVGLPRYDTVEAREQWTQLRGDILVYADGVPYPGYLYYIAEYVQMIREVFAGTSPSQRKAPARIERLYAILQLPPVGPLVDRERQELVDANLLPLSLAAVGQVADGPSRSALIVLLRQFAIAYGLARDRGLAADFDASFAQDLPNMHARAAYTPALNVAIAAATVAGSWTAGCGMLADAIGYCEATSQAMEAHFVARAEFVYGQRVALNQLLQALFANSIFSPTEELEVQLAVDGSFGAASQGLYTGYPHRDELDPVTYVSLGLYSPREDADPATMIELVKPAVVQYLQFNPGAFTLDDSAPDALRLYWANLVAIPPFGYLPLAVEIVAVPPPERPLLSYIWGLGTLGLRDLVVDFRRKAADTEEYGRRVKLRQTAAALADMMIRAANPEPANPAIAGLRQGVCHHLMISSASNAIGRGAAYPRSYYPDPALGQPYAAFLQLLTANRPALLDAVTLGGAAVDRSLDLLVLNQGHGDFGAFAGWKAEDLKTYLVDPLVASGVRANILILDFCLSASLLDTFAPLCAPDGIIVSNLYSIAEVIVTTELWTTIQPALAERDLAALRQAIETRMRFISTGLTGFAHLEQVRSEATETQIAEHLAAYPNDRDPISIIRYLPRIAGGLDDAGMPLARTYALLDAVRGLANLGFAEQQILASLPPQQALFTASMRTAIESQFGERLVQILTQPNYGLQLNVAGRPLFGEDSLWSLVVAQRGQLLALAAGLTRCPTPFSEFAPDGAVLTLDNALAAAEIAPDVARLMNRVYPGAPAEAEKILQASGGTVSILNQVHNYLQ